MDTLRLIQVSIELWGSFFSLSFAILVFVTRRFEPVAARQLMVMLIIHAAALGSDVLAWLFRGDPSVLGYYMVRVSNFCYFLFLFLVLAALSGYVSYLVKSYSGRNMRIWQSVEMGITLCAVLVLIFSRVFGFLYDFDGKNRYYRTELGWLPGAFGVLGLVLILWILVRYGKHMKKLERFSLYISVGLPIVGILMQMFHYGISYTNLALTCALLILFLGYEHEYTAYMVNKERQLNEARIRQINRQMQPHFIFNSLATIRALCRNSPEGVEAINALAGFLRGTMELLDRSDCIAAQKEFELVRQYLTLMQKRFAGAVQVTYDLQDEDFAIPPFVVQTLAENAIKHGIRKKNTRKGSICIRSYATEFFHVIEIQDDGVGFDARNLKNEQNTGIYNTMQRLQLMCGGMLEIESKEGTGTTAKVFVPRG